MRAVAFVGSPRVEGNTELLTNMVLEIMAAGGVETELVRLAGREILPCIACGGCTLEEACPLDDGLLPLYHKAKAADAIILASPVYFSSVSGKMKAFMDRVGYISYENGYTLKRKVGGPLAVAGRNGGNFTNSQLLLWFMILGMVVPGSTDWNCAFGNEIGEVWDDREGVNNIRVFAENLVWLMKKLAKE